MCVLVSLQASELYSNSLSTSADDTGGYVNWSRCCRSGDGGDDCRQTARAVDQRRAGLCAATAAHRTTSEKLATGCLGRPVL